MHQLSHTCAHMTRSMQTPRDFCSLPGGFCHSAEWAIAHWGDRMTVQIREVGTIGIRCSVLNHEGDKH